MANKTPVGAAEIQRLAAIAREERVKAREARVRAERAEAERLAAQLQAAAASWLVAIERLFLEGQHCVKVTGLDRAQILALGRILGEYGYLASDDYGGVYAFHPDSGGFAGGARVVTLSDLPLGEPCEK